MVNSKRLFLGLILLAAVAALVGCSSAPNPVYYRIGHQPPVQSVDTSTGLVLMVDRMSATGPLGQPNIVHRVTDHSLVYEPYRFWESAPVEMATTSLVNGLRDSAAFRRVTTKRLARDVDLVLRGRLTRFEWATTGKGEQAEIMLDYQIYDPATDKVIATGGAEAKVPAVGKGMDAVAGAMSRALSQVTGLVIGEVIAAVRNQ